MMFNLTVDELEKKKAIYTAKEIFQQPTVWQELLNIIELEGTRVKKFLESIICKHDITRIIFTGAGTSAFIGDLIVPELRSQNNKKVLFEAIPTTDIVSNPSKYIIKEFPTILVSFARSGNSPESVATVELGKKIVDHLYQVVITCNKDGQLAKQIGDDENGVLVLLPEKANDHGFAMTSSFTSMALAAYLLFSTKKLSKDKFNQLIDNAQKLLNSITNVIDKILAFDFDRIVYLGSGLLGKLSHEAALKMLELTAGKVVAVHESSLGFRHGPKSILNNKTLVVIFLSQNPYTRKYDIDILKEIAIDSLENKIIALTEKDDEKVRNLADWMITVNHHKKDNVESDFLLALLYIIFAQTLALKKSLQLGITPDNPSPDGRVNRVVKGVNIYPWNEKK